MPPGSPAVTGEPAASAAPLRPRPNGFATWDVTVSALPGTAGGRYFLTARITDGLGQVLEDTALVTIGEAGAPDPHLEPEELFFRLQSDVMALAGEADLERAHPGGAARRRARAASWRCASPATWPRSCAARCSSSPPSAPGRPPGRGRSRSPSSRAATATRPVRRHGPGDGRARLGVVAAGEADVLRPRPLLGGRPAHRGLAARPHSSGLPGTVRRVRYQGRPGGLKIVKDCGVVKARRHDARRAAHGPAVPCAARCCYH